MLKMPWSILLCGWSLIKHAEIRLHQGFAQAAESLYLAIRPHLNKNYKITTTGHSLGGAVALILAMYLDKDHYLLDKVVTFGQPKVTNVTGAQHYRHLKRLARGYT